MSEQSEALRQAMIAERRLLVQKMLLAGTGKTFIIADVSTAYRVPAQTVRLDIAQLEGPGRRTNKQSRQFTIADLMASGLPLRILIPQVAEDYNVKEATIRLDLEQIGSHSEALLKRRKTSEAKLAACYDRLETLASQSEHMPSAVKAIALLMKEYGIRQDRNEMEANAAELARINVALAAQRVKQAAAQTAVAEKLANQDGDLLGDVTVVLGSLAGPASDADLDAVGATRADMVDPLADDA